MMNHPRAYALIRTLILGSATLAIVGVLFAVYQSVQGGPGLGDAPEAVQRDLGPIATSNSADQGDGSVELDPGVEVRGGTGVTISLYDQQGDQAVATISCAEWKPIPGSDNQVHVQALTMRMRTPNGQRITISAEQGFVRITEKDAGRPDMLGGTLVGSVKIQIDRLDEKGRAALTEEERDNPTPDRLVTISMDELEFDREHSRIGTTGPFRLTSKEIDLNGIGLLVRYNEVDASIDHLEISSQGRIVARSLGSQFKIALPGSEESSAKPRSTKSGEAEEAADEALVDTTPAQMLPDDGIPILSLPQKKRKKHPTLRYSAVFNQEVDVRQFAQSGLASSLMADLLEVEFEFGQKERSQAKTRTASPGDSGAAAESQPAGNDGAEAEAETSTQDEMILTWAGPLVVEVLERVEPTDAGQTPKKSAGIKMTATGKEVRLVQVNQAAVRCSKMIYHDGDDHAWLYGTPESPAVVTTSDGGLIESPEMDFDIKHGTAQIMGPGRMADSSGGAVRSDGSSDEVDIRFQDEINAVFAAELVESIDPETLELVAKRRRYLKHAILTGSVEMRQAADFLAGERIEVSFALPQNGNSFADTIERLQGEGSVVLIHGQDSVKCDRIDVQMGVDEGGRTSPRLARAFGHVVATQDERQITAGEKMLVTLRSFRVEKAPWDIEVARSTAVDRGFNPDEVDWEAQRIKYESQDEFRPGILRLEAFGGVAVHDPKQRFDLTAQALDCTFKDGRDIDKATVTGDPFSPAYVEMGDYSITGGEIFVNVGTESTEVPGAGRMTFRSSRDLDGRVLDRPVPVAVTWSESMVYRGSTERAVITGDVHAATKDSTFDCGEMTIVFADKLETTVMSADKKNGADWWVFAPLVARASDLFGSGDSSRPAFAANFGKEPIYLQAAGGAVALTTKSEPGTGRTLSRGRIEGPKILVDLRAEAMTVEDAGNLLIEDYELPSIEQVKKASPVEDRSPFGGMNVGKPSQTFISWTGQMSYYYGRQAAFFSKDVEMMHLSGAETLLSKDVVGSATYSAALASGFRGGRNAALTCNELAVQFQKGDAGAARQESGAGEMSGYALSRFQADGQVHFQDSGIVVLAQKVTYDADSTTMTLWGGDREMASIYDQRSRFTGLKAKLIEWNRKTGDINAPGSTVFGR